ncbi:glycogen synthase GlgA [soil metagenome]
MVSLYVRGMKILLAASELAPFVRSGDLADVIADLSGELRKAGHEVSVAIPYYRAVREAKIGRPKKSSIRFSVQIGASKMPCDLYEVKAPNGVQVYLIARDEYFDRSGIYGTEERDYQDNAARFIFFTKSVLELAKKTKPDILHANSWEAALLPVFVRDQQLAFRTVLTPHGLDYQGNFWSYDFGLTNLPGEYFSARGVEYYGSMNCLKGGILFADAVILPSERFVCEAQTPEHGCGLENVLRENSFKLSGIQPGNDLDSWDPAAYATLPAKFAERSKNRTALRQALELADDVSAKTWIAFPEADGGKGFDLLLASLDRLLARNVQLLILGSLGPENLRALEIARRKHKGAFAQVDEFDEKLARLALAGADMCVVPGAAEPRAVWLRRALRYGVIPVAMQCGGLFQFVRDWEPSSKRGNGFVFQSSTTEGLVDVCERAAVALNDPTQLEGLRKNCLNLDLSKEASARAHIALYERLLAGTGLSKAA